MSKGIRPVRPGEPHPGKGWILRVDSSGRQWWVHQSASDRYFHPEATSIRDPRSQRGSKALSTPQTYTFDKTQLTYLEKRTPQQRVESLALKMAEECLRTGLLPRSDDPVIRQIVAEAWKSGRPDITSDTIRQLAQRYLERAEVQDEIKQGKQITRDPRGGYN